MCFADFVHEFVISCWLSVNFSRNSNGNEGKLHRKILVVQYDTVHPSCDTLAHNMGQYCILLATCIFPQPVVGLGKI